MFYVNARQNITSGPWPFKQLLPNNTQSAQSPPSSASVTNGSSTRLIAYSLHKILPPTY